jgi:hypothetical protein
MFAIARQAAPTLPSSRGRTRTTAGGRVAEDGGAAEDGIAAAYRAVRVDTAPAREYVAAMPASPIRAYLFFTGTGPILVLSTYPELTDERLISKLRYKGIDKLIAYEVDLEAVRQRYAEAYRSVAGDLEGEEDLRVLDFNGHQIMANFSLAELGDPVKVGDDS